ncbi:MAG: M24 family metallopeptidase [Candidatus Helarchaeota archaeon]
MKTRIELFQNALQEKRLDAFLIMDIINAYYLTNFYSISGAALLVFPEASPILFIPALEFEEAKQTAQGCIIKKLEKRTKLIDLIKKEVETNRIKKLGINETNLTVKSYKELTKKLKSVTFKEQAKVIENLRKAKDESEIKKIRKACAIADAGIIAATEIIEEGKSEIEVAAEIEYIMRKKGSEKSPFDTIIASGYRSAYPHGLSSTKKIRKGDPIIIDLGATYQGYCSDLTRTLFLGTPSPQIVELFDSVLDTQQKAINQCKIGEKAADLDKFARQAFAVVKLENYFVHALGHGVGLEIHEPPALAEQSEDLLEENNVFTIEPGIYVPKVGGVRIEDTVLLTKRGAIRLTKSAYKIEI